MLVVENRRKYGMRADDAVLVEQRQLAARFEHALDHEHHVRAARVVLVEHERDRPLQRPGQQAFAELGDLLAVLEHDRVLADEIDAADVAVEVDADQRPVEARGHLLDVGRLARAVIALHHHAPVVSKARQDRERGLGIEAVAVVAVGHVFAVLRKRRHHHFAVHAKVARRNLDVRPQGNEVVGSRHVMTPGESTPTSSACSSAGLRGTCRRPAPIACGRGRATSGRRGRSS